jgi:hypothetical protein
MGRRYAKFGMEVISISETFIVRLGLVNEISLIEMAKVVDVHNHIMARLWSPLASLP